MKAAGSRPGEIEDTLARALGYSLLAYAFAYPHDDVVAGLRDVADLAGDVLDETPLGPLCSYAARASKESLEPGYVSLFTVGYSPDCPTFETAYVATDLVQSTNCMADIAGFYRAFGVDSAGGGFRPDDISVELEFMAFLCRKEAYAREHLGAARVSQSLGAQRMFLREHLGRWSGGAGRRVAACAEPGSFYAEAGRALAGWIHDDAARLKAGRLETVDAPQLEWPEPPDQAEPGPQFIDPSLLPLT